MRHAIRAALILSVVVATLSMAASNATAAPPQLLITNEPPNTIEYKGSGFTHSYNLEWNVVGSVAQWSCYIDGVAIPKGFLANQCSTAFGDYALNAQGLSWNEEHTVSIYVCNAEEECSTYSKTTQWLKPAPILIWTNVPEAITTSTTAALTYIVGNVADTRTCRQYFNSVLIKTTANCNANSTTLSNLAIGNHRFTYELCQFQAGCQTYEQSWAVIAGETPTPPNNPQPPYNPPNNPQPPNNGKDGKDGKDGTPGIVGEHSTTQVITHVHNLKRVLKTIKAPKAKKGCKAKAKAKTKKCKVKTKKLRLRLGSDLLFNFDSYSLTAKGKTVLQKLNKRLRTVKVLKARIEGNASYEGNPSQEAYNKTLSLNRANTVRAALKKGLARTKTKVVANGTRKPVATNATAAGRAANRNVQITLVYTRR